MLKESLIDTIAAISTCPGEGGIGIVRLSGKDALSIADKVFIGRDKIKPSECKSYTMHYGVIAKDGKVIDEVILTLMRQPRSYTKEDVVEINCHGGIVALRACLELVLEKGCRLAFPGEFTKRAFLNGRLDLAQAEAVIDVIRAKTDSALGVSLGQLRGLLSREVNAIRKSLLEELSFLDASIDFPEEGIKQPQQPGELKGLHKISASLDQLVSGSSAGRIFREGIRVVICGRPNVGKSSLLNALLKKERAIVTAVAGTTRDVLEEVIDIQGIPVLLVDTAGMLKPRDVVERKAVRLSKKHIHTADLVVVIFDGSEKLQPEDKKLIRQLKGKAVIAVINKIDLRPRIEKTKISGVFGQPIAISAKRSRNIDELKEAIAQAAFKGRVPASEHALVSNLRHIHSLREARKLVLEAQKSLADQLPAEFVAQSLKEAISLLDKILGKSFSEDLLDKIFSDFCIGK
jgi:tRNA modification GTPase